MKWPPWKSARQWHTLGSRNPCVHTQLPRKLYSHHRVQGTGSAHPGKGDAGLLQKWIPLMQHREESLVRLMLPWVFGWLSFPK